jgi:hypothetical protein
MCPITYKIDHEEHLVHATARGDVFLDDILNYFDAVSIGDAMSYGKLFDAREMVPHLSDDDFMVVAAYVSAYAAFDPRGPIAAVATTAPALFALQRYANFAGGEGRPLSLFGCLEEAADWLKCFPRLGCGGVVVGPVLFGPVS